MVGEGVLKETVLWRAAFPIKPIGFWKSLAEKAEKAQKQAKVRVLES